MFAAPISRRIGATSRLAKFSPSQAAESKNRQRDHGVHQREGDLHADSARFERCVFGDARTSCLQLRDDPRIERVASRKGKCRRTVRSLTMAAT